MKTLPLTIAITGGLSAAVIIIFAVIILLQPASKAGDYQYEIHESYKGVDKDFGTVIIENQTYHVTNLKSTYNSHGPTWIEMYNVNFSFPNGYGPQITPGGTIYETYVKFPDEQVPYRLAAGLSSLPGAPHYHITTVLSTHREPQAGFTIHNDTIQLLVNWSKIHSSLSIQGLNSTYEQGEPIDFKINVNGFDYFNAAETPQIQVVRPNGGLVWTVQDHGMGTRCCVPELVNYSKQFNLTELGGPIIIDKVGTYNLTISYNNQRIQKQFSVVQTSITINYKPATQDEQIGKDIVLQKPSSMVKPFPRCNPNPTKEKLIREKVQILTDALLDEETKYGGFENRTQNLPWSGIGYDCMDNALEVYILPQYFNSDSFPKYFEKIRSIVGNTIDVVLSPEEYATPV
jgi:hypothetical protein